ncbi:MAG: PilC/PilY family type IV pilus protein, partial [Candidatus Competibacteraceae bacterium]|nr:PilC/PilY family type IV pilus protein [Candidatus Competibacteraceae bacterium]
NTCTADCTKCSELALTHLAADKSTNTPTALWVADATERGLLIDWVRGADDLDENLDGYRSDVRPSLHGDVLHSRPAVINYNRGGEDKDVVVFYGANDGVFHAALGGLEAGDGRELWGFVPSEFFPQLKTLWNNDTLGHPYFFDGSVAVLTEDRNEDGRLVAQDGDRVHLFLTLRRGGRLLYALDVSEPERPRFLWKRSYRDTGFGELGQSWSEPRVARINLNGSSTEVLIFGLGYDPLADDLQPAAAATMGRGVMVVEAATGDPIWQAGPEPAGAQHNLTVAEMIYSIPSDIKVLNRDGDPQRLADRAYVGDSGGNLWRLDLHDSNPANWTVSRLASLGGTTDGEKRKFLFAPEVVYHRDDTGAFDALYIGSGDREHPFSISVADRFYMVKDRRIDPAAPQEPVVVEEDLYDATDNLVQMGTADQRQAAKTELASKRGWYVRLREGEKVVGGVVVVAGSTFFSTHQPSLPDANQCNSLGTARNYVLDFMDASATTDWDGVDGLTTLDRTVEIPGGGFPPSPVSVITQVDGRIRGAVVIGTWVADGPAPSDVRQRVYRFREME